MRKHVTVEIRMTGDNPSPTRIEQALRAFIHSSHLGLDAKEVDVRARVGKEVEVNEHGYATPLPSLY